MTYLLRISAFLLASVIFFIYVFFTRQDGLSNTHITFLFLFLIFSTLDGLMTIRGLAGGNYDKEFNFVTRYVFKRYGLYGRALYWLSFTSLFLWLSYLGGEFGKIVLVAATIGTFFGFLSWTPLNVFVKDGQNINLKTKNYLFSFLIFIIFLLGNLVYSRFPF